MYEFITKYVEHSQILDLTDKQFIHLLINSSTNAQIYTWLIKLCRNSEIWHFFSQCKDWST